MNIKERLRQIDSTRLKHGLSVSPGISQPFPSNPGVEEQLIGTIREAESGSVLVRERDFSLEHMYGVTQIGSFLDTSASLLPFVGKSMALKDVDLSRIIFLDTETTGLSGGAGTCAFLIGLGYFHNGQFRVTQLFMRDFGDEGAQLDQLNALLTEHQAVATYNGKTFDVPLLQSRNVLHRIRTRLDSLAHLDLLHAVRRHWKQSLPDCSLGSAEMYLLNAGRTGDVPGFLIPQIYFDYLRTQDSRHLNPVFYHNQCDILALVGIATKLLHLFADPIGEAHGPHELLTVGKVYENMHMFDRSIELYDQALTGSSQDGLRQAILFRKALTCKRLKLWTEAASVWQESLVSGPFHPLPFIELAKHAEHRERSVANAMTLVEKALKEIEVVEFLKVNQGWKDYKDDLEHRRRRLRRKLKMGSQPRE